MTAVTRGLGPDSLKTRCSNEEGAAEMVMALVVMSVRKIVAMVAWFSLYEYSGGVV